MGEGADDWQRDVDASRTAFFLDVDGTLLDFKDRPEDVVADEALRSILRDLAAAADGAVALVSGRMVDDLDRIVAPLVLPVGGVHGADLRFSDGRRETLEGAALAEVRDKAEDFVTAHKGLRLEDKGATLAIHYRLAPEHADAVAAFADAAVANLDLMVQHGKMVAEIKSSLCHKGRAIEMLMQTPPFVGRVPLFIGDDRTDEYGFRTVNDLHGVSVKVGSEEESTGAVRRLDDPSAVQKFLGDICRSGEKRE